MKRWLCAILAVGLLALPACTQPQPKETYGGVPCPVDKLQWGMTPEEALTALGVPLDTPREEKEDQTQRGSYRSVSILLPGRWEVYGSRGDVRLNFYDRYQDLQAGLVSVGVNYGAQAPEEDLLKRIEEEAAPYTDFHGDWWQSKKKLEDMPYKAVHRYFGLEEGAVPFEWDRALGTIIFGSKSGIQGVTVVTVENVRAVVLHKGLQKMEMDKIKEALG